VATSVQVAQLRLLIAQSEDVSPYTEAELSARIDTALANLNAVARDVWTEKAAAYADLVDASEGGSSRKMGDLHEQALNMVQFFTELAPRPAVIGRGARRYKLGR
jgi:Cdc6-like AAA superfamily ATPase